MKKEVVKEIDRIIKETWVKNIAPDYDADHLLKEGSLQCGMYYHLRRKLSKILQENNLRIYPEFWISELQYSADLAIVEIDRENLELPMRDRVKDVIAILELKYKGGNSQRVEEEIKHDRQKLKNYFQIAKLDCQYYLAVIYETQCSSLNWLGRRSTENWAKGHVSELDAGYLDGEMWFKVNSYNDMNLDIKG